MEFVKNNSCGFRILKMIFGFVIFLILFTNIDGLGVGSGNDGNLRVCVVEGRGIYKKAAKNCPILEKYNTGIECVVGHDRLDCLRRIGKGTADFGVFYPEDLIAAEWAGIDILITNELKTKPQPFEYEVVALISKAAGNAEDGLQAILRDTTMCHPGYGANEDFSEALSNYLESLVTERSCDPLVTLAENRIRSSASFFKAACKAGPWVPDKALDAELKGMYGSLCAACYGGACSAGDKYWGRQGALNCLTEHAGDFAWARMGDARAHFGFTGRPDSASPAGFEYLCRDGSVMPLTNDTAPCTWVAKPWPVIAAKRKSSLAVSHIASELTSVLTPVLGSWQGALLALLDMYRALAPPLAPPRAPLDYLSATPGFRAAYSIAGCSPPRYISVCTWSLSGQHACDWLSEAGRVLGVEPPLQCTRAPDMYACAANTTGDADAANVIVATSDFLVPARRDFNLTPILYETTPILLDLNPIVTYVKRTSPVKSFADMRGLRVSIPTHDGVAWHTIVQELRKLDLLDPTKCPYEVAMAEFFGESCVPGIQNADWLDDAVKQKLTRACNQDAVAHELTPDVASLRMLVEDSVDVAILTLATMENFTITNAPTEWSLKINSSDFRPIRPKNSNDKYNYTAWSTIGQIYVRRDTSAARRREISTAFLRLDQLFGKNYMFHTAAFSMYGPFNEDRDVLFHEKTRALSGKSALKSHPLERYPRNFEGTLDQYKYGVCEKSTASSSRADLLSAILVSVASFLTERLRNQN